jgi:hypothetical protein
MEIAGGAIAAPGSSRSLVWTHLISGVTDVTRFFEEIVMDTYRQDSGYTSISGLTAANFKPLTSEETATYRGWRRAVVAFYCCVVLLGGFVLVASVPAPHREMAQVMPAVNVP